MSASFSLQADRARDLVRIRMSGLFTTADIGAFLEARQKAHAELACAPNQHVTLNDLRGMKIQPQDAVAAFRLMLSDPAYRSRRLAFVISQTLARSQLARALNGRDHVRCFDDVGEAEAWLFADAPAVRPLPKAAAA
jgi:hypothetical protein